MELVMNEQQCKCEHDEELVFTVSQHVKSLFLEGLSCELIRYEVGEFYAFKKFL